MKVAPVSHDPPWVHLGPVEFWRAAWQTSVAANVRWRDAEADEAFWSGFAEDYDDRSPLAECATDLIADLRALLAPGDTLLEIGAGTGAFTRRLADGLSAICCVEPSAAMRRVFVSNWDQPIEVEFVPVDWLDAPADLSADIVLCANALYRTENIAAALEKMTLTARKHVAIVQTIGRPHAGPLQFREQDRLWERERADALCDVLHHLGIQANRTDYRVNRPDGPSDVALITWPAREHDSTS